MPASKKPSAATSTAIAFLNFCEPTPGLGLKVRLKPTGGVVSVEASFTPYDNTWYCHLEMRANAALDMLGAKGGSRWGSTSDSVGGAAALTSGRFVMNISGVPLRVVAALRKTGRCIEG